MTLASLSAARLTELIRSTEELTIVDLREKGLFGLGHMLHACNIAYSDLEHQAPLRLPRRDVQICLIAADRALCELAGRRLATLGYTRIAWLDGGMEAWSEAGGEVFIGEDVIPKAFGEIVEHDLGTPNIDPAELAARRAQGERIVVLDGRTPAEHRGVSIPDSISVPNGELLLRVGDLVPEDATVVVTCAGRTRSIIGAQTLINAGLSNPVLALRGGTQGWRMAGLPLREGSTASYGPQTRQSDLTADALGSGLESLEPIPWISRDDLGEVRRTGRRTTYLLDIRAEEEFTAGHIAGAVHAPGGQLVQAVGRSAPVLRALLVLIDAAPHARARSAAHWLRQMGYDARILDLDAATTMDEAGPPIAAAPVSLPAAAALVDGPKAVTLAREGAAVVCAGPGMAYREAHAAGALWAIRPNLQAHAPELAGRDTILVMADSDERACLAAIDLAEQHPRTRIAVLKGWLPAWRAAGGAVEASPGVPADRDCIDYLFWAHDRQKGNDQATLAYFNWELGLPEQIRRDGTAGFRLFHAAPPARDDT